MAVDAARLAELVFLLFRVAFDDALVKLEEPLWSLSKISPVSVHIIDCRLSGLGISGTYKFPPLFDSRLCFRAGLLRAAAFPRLDALLETGAIDVRSRGASNVPRRSSQADCGAYGEVEFKSLVDNILESTGEGIREG
jgi:hypothetical protein